MHNNLLVICGPTATGKTKLSIEIAKAKNGEIISADSMQVYKGMDIGTAKPSDDEKQGIPHYLIDEIEPSQLFSVAKYKELATGYIQKIQSEGKLPILVGGTGLYINSVINNIEFSNYEADYEYRKTLYDLAEKQGGIALKEMLFHIDEKTANNLHSNDIKRLARALEVYKVTGKTQSHLNELSRQTQAPYNTLVIGLTYKDRETLYEKINTRVDIMMKNDLEKEVRNLLSNGLDQTCTAMQAIGYKELIRHFKGELSRQEAIDSIKQESRRYAKRQLTWFRREKEIYWVEVDQYENYENIFKIILKYMEINGF